MENPSLESGITAQSAAEASARAAQSHAQVDGSANGMRIDARYNGKTVLAVGAHPDDLELGIGGTLGRLSGVARVVMVVVSVPNELETRVGEAKRAAAILGCELRVLIAHRCCRVEDLKSYELVGMLDGLVKELRPALVLSHGASDFHRDHQLVFDACLSSQRLLPYDLLCYHPTMTRRMPVPFNPQAYVDVSQTIEMKIDAISAHVSQFAKRGLPVEVFRDEARDMGQMVGLEYAEGLEIGRLMLV